MIAFMVILGAMLFLYGLIFTVQFIRVKDALAEVMEKQGFPVSVVRRTTLFMQVLHIAIAVGGFAMVYYGIRY